jgi:hypothetical protein
MYVYNPHGDRGSANRPPHHRGGQQRQEAPEMEEDELGTQRALGHAEYVACARCGRMTPKQSAAIVPGDALEDQSEFQYLCQECQAALAAGEQDLPTTLV